MPVSKKALELGDSPGVAGSAVAPANGAAIATIASGSLPAGEYEVRVKSAYGGTADVANGMELRKAAVKIMSLHVPPAINAQPDTTIVPRVTLDGTQALSVNASQAGAVSSVYLAELIATRLN